LISLEVSSTNILLFRLRVEKDTLTGDIMYSTVIPVASKMPTDFIVSMIMISKQAKG